MLTLIGYLFDSIHHVSALGFIRATVRYCTFSKSEKFTERKNDKPDNQFIVAIGKVESINHLMYHRIF